ncbi:MAG: NUDIX domain-containing protein [Methanosphaera sp.]|nr:NUDIX domain-containing protein [Methanosphaera sp.]
MKTFNMYVKTLIPNEKGKILLVKEKRMDERPRWDLPGVALTEDESFDEAVTKSIQKEIGYYVYPGKIIGVKDFITHETKEINVIMEANILNGDILLNDHYEKYSWVSMERITEYPLAPWFNEYMKRNKRPFEDVEYEIEQINQRQYKRRELIQEDIISRRSDDSIYKIEDNEVGESVKNSFGLLKDTIIRTFHPKQANVRRTQPKENVIYSTTNNDKEDIIPDAQEDEEITTISTEKPKIRKIRENNRPYIRKVKESTEKISFNTNRKASNWKEKLNNINKTPSNNERRPAPKPRRRQ